MSCLRCTEIPDFFLSISRNSCRCRSDWVYVNITRWHAAKSIFRHYGRVYLFSPFSARFIMRAIEIVARDVCFIKWRNYQHQSTLYGACMHSNYLSYDLCQRTKGICLFCNFFKLSFQLFFVRIRNIFIAFNWFRSILGAFSYFFHACTWTYFLSFDLCSQV